MRNTALIALALGAIVLAVAVAVGGYLGGWWLREDSINREAEIRRGSFEFQETSRDEIVRQAEQLAELDVSIATPGLDPELEAALRGQREAARAQLCQVAAGITGSVTPTVDRIILQEC